MLTSPKKPSRFPLLQSMEFVVTISNTDRCIQIMKDTDDLCRHHEDALAVE